MGAAEVGALLGVGRQRVTQLTTSRGFPKPYATLAMGKVWRAADVRAWHEARKTVMASSLRSSRA